MALWIFALLGVTCFIPKKNMPIWGGGVYAQARMRVRESL